MLLLDLSSSLNSLHIDNLVASLWGMAMMLGKKLIVVAIFFIIANWVISWIRKIVNKMMERNHIDKAVATFVNSLVNVALKGIMIISIVGILGIETTSLAAIVASLGLAIGMAMKDNLSNFAGGVMLLMNKPFQIGNKILFGAMEGVVSEIGVLYTVLRTADNRTVYLPNGPLSTGNIINYSSQSTKLVEIVLSITNGYNLDEVKMLLTDVVQNEVSTNMGMVLNDPLPFVGVTKLNNSSFDITIKVWVKSEVFTLVSTRMNEEIYQILSEKQIYTQPSLRVNLDKS